MAALTLRVPAVGCCEFAAALRDGFAALARVFRVLVQGVLQQQKNCQKRFTDYTSQTHVIFPVTYLKIARTRHQQG